MKNKVTLRMCQLDCKFSLESFPIEDINKFIIFALLLLVWLFDCFLNRHGFLWFSRLFCDFRIFRLFILGDRVIL